MPVREMPDIWGAGIPRIIAGLPDAGINPQRDRPESQVPGLGRDGGEEEPTIHEEGGVMKRIFEYNLRSNDYRVEMPEGAKILTVREQFGNICIWAEIDPEQPMVFRYFEVLGARQTIPESMGQSREYIGTVALEGGKLIFHIYEYTGI